MVDKNTTVAELAEKLLVLGLTASISCKNGHWNVRLASKSAISTGNSTELYEAFNTAIKMFDR